MSWVNTNAGKYCFAVEDRDGVAFEIEILPSDDRAREHLQSVWQRLATCGVVLQEGKPSSTGMGGLAALEMVRRQARGLCTPAKVRRVVRVELGSGFSTSGRDFLLSLKRVDIPSISSTSQPLPETSRRNSGIVDILGLARPFSPLRSS